jgi:hypothetical protein
LQPEKKLSSIGKRCTVTRTQRGYAKAVTISWTWGLEMAYLKQSEVKQLAKKAKAVTAPPVPPGPPKARGESADVPSAIDRLASIFSTYVTNERDGENGSSLYSRPLGYPVRIAIVGADGEDEQELSVALYLHGDAVDSIADSLKRIADAMTK